MNTNMTGFRVNSKVVASCALDDSSLTIERVIYLRINNSKCIAHTNDNEHNRITGRIAKSWGTVLVSLICHTPPSNTPYKAMLTYSPQRNVGVNM